MLDTLNTKTYFYRYIVSAVLTKALASMTPLQKYLRISKYYKPAPLIYFENFKKFFHLVGK